MFPCFFFEHNLTPFNHISTNHSSIWDNFPGTVLLQVLGAFQQLFQDQRRCLSLQTTKKKHVSQVVPEVFWRPISLPTIYDLTNWVSQQETQNCPAPKKTHPMCRTSSPGDIIGTIRDFFSQFTTWSGIDHDLSPITMIYHDSIYHVVVQLGAVLHQQIQQEMVPRKPACRCGGSRK